MRKVSSKTPKKTKNIKKIIKKSSIKRIIPKAAKKKKIILKEESIPQAPIYSLPAQKESVAIEKVKFTAVQEATNDNNRYSLPLRYLDNRITILARDPWWIHTYWDISEQRINEVISSIPVYERENLKWILRVYDLTGVSHFDGKNANSFFDITIHFEANNWYINVNQPERARCVEIG
ncbi:MAG: DUF4912 domain-containing protein, partial [Candidatus Omnitrophica bacterium]|nr:DUF4912 domain-containing protein [Candidatus Omnitrophota bacterium]